MRIYVELWAVLNKLTVKGLDYKIRNLGEIHVDGLYASGHQV